MKLYVVKEGSQIQAVFSTREKALAYIGTATEDGHSRVEEWELDGERSTRLARPVYRVWMWLAGSLSDRYPPFLISSPNMDAELPRDTAEGSTELQPDWLSESREMAVVVAKSYVSAEHALELAAEARQAWLREQDVKARG